MKAPVLRAYKPKRYIPKVVKHEESVQRQVCSYLRKHYPHVIFRSDFASGLQLTMNQARIHKSLQSSRAWPDIFIYEPMQHDGKMYYGLALELKKEGTTIQLKIGANKGKLTTNPHIREQALLLKELIKRGYYGNFACGYDQAVNIIDWYFHNTTPDNAELPF